MKPLSRHRLSSTGFFIALCFVCVWPALLNGSPFYFPDTTAYIKGAAAGMQKFTGLHSEWLDDEPIVAALASPGRAGSGSRSPLPIVSSSAAAAPVTVLSGRSVYYGGIVLAAQFVNTWLAVLWQAAVAVCIVMLTFRRATAQLVAEGASLQPRTVVLLLAALTALPFFCSIEMPDLFASLAILSTAALLSLRCGPKARLAYLLVIAGGALFHSANVLLCLALPLGYLACSAFSPATRAHGKQLLALAVIGAAAVGIAGEMAFKMVTAHAIGSAPLRPPFMSARLIADGPGEDFLRKDCLVEDRWRLCKFAGRPLDRNSDLLLWSKDSAVGIFTAVPADDKKAISDQDTQFALAVVQAYPLRSLTIALANVSKQLVLLDLKEFNNTGGDLEVYQKKLPESEFRSLKTSRSASNGFPDVFFAALQQTTLVISAGLLVYLLMSRRRQISQSGLSSFFALCVSGVLLNALVCGLLSTPHSRYQARVAWLIVFLVLILVKLPARVRPADRSPAASLGAGSGIRPVH